MSGQYSHECNKAGCFFCYEISRITGTVNCNPLEQFKDNKQTRNVAVKDTKTGLIYSSILRASELSGINVSTLRAWVRNERFNKSSFVLAYDKAPKTRLYRKVAAVKGNYNTLPEVL